MDNDYAHTFPQIHDINSVVSVADSSHLCVHGWILGFEFKGMPNEERYSRAERYLAHSLAVHVCLLEVAGGFSSLRALTPFEKARIGLFSRKCPIELDHNFHSSLNLSLCFPSMYVMDLLYE